MTPGGRLVVLGGDDSEVEGVEKVDAAVAASPVLVRRIDDIGGDNAEAT